MNKSKKLIGMMALCVVLMTGCLAKEADNTIPAESGNAATTATTNTKATSLGYAEEIDKNKIMSLSIDADEAEWQKMLDSASEEQYISANVTINGTTITNVGIRPKGNSSLRQIVNDDTTDRFSFKIKFDEYVKDQTWEGLDTLVANNMISDNSYMKEYLSYDIMSEIGVDTPLFAFANIKVNGNAWGLYLAVEAVDSGYLERTKEDEGELYKPNNDDKDTMGGGAKNGKGGGMRNGAQNGVSLAYTDDAISSYSAIFDNAETKTTEEDNQRVITALKNLNAGTDLSKYVDVDAVLKYFAAHTVVVNMDSYTSSMGHNYYLYENNGQISLVPWDYNMAFGGFQAGTASDVVNLAIDTPLSGITLEERPILGKLLEVPAYKEKYHAYLQEIMDKYFADGKFAQKVASLNQLISTEVQNDPTAFATYAEYQTAVAELTKLGTLRAESIQGQLSGTIPSTTDGQKADASHLVDASSVDLAKLGNGPGGKGMPGGGGSFGGGGGMPAGLDRDTMQKAFAIIQSASNGTLTAEQKAQLTQLGLTEEQINQMLSMPQHQNR